MTRALLLLAFLSNVTVLQEAPAHARIASSCTAEQFGRFSRDNRPGNRISLDCSLILPEGFRVTANLVFEGAKASDTVLDCSGGTIDVAHGKSRIDRTAIIVRSLPNADGTWDAPTGITVRNCIIKGFVRLYGLDENANGASMKASSRNPDHTALAQAAAPKDTILDNLTIVAPRGIPLYIGPGVTRTTFENSLLKGKSSGTAIYLDAESARNTIHRNTFDITTEKRELIAIDGSARNTIVGNRFNDPVNGGIFLYRNCGEGGVIRHQTPNFNVISDNSFVYREKAARKPAVWLSSRKGKQRYCFIDPRYRFGSSKSPLDYARKNVVSLNRIVGGGPNAIRNDDLQRNIRERR